MIFRNFTPFPPLHFESRDEKQNDFGVVVLRGTFKIENGCKLRMVEDQEPILFKDEYFGDPQKSSLQFDSCMAPFMPKTDVLVNANAYSPTWKPEKFWDVSFSLGDRTKQLVVTGPRRWERALGRFHLSEFTPVDSVPIRYELAYGGSYIDTLGERRAWEENPIGLGYVDPDNKDSINAPQIFKGIDAASKLSYGRPCETAGLGPVAPHWAPRSQKVGTYNELWKRTRCPDLPADFDFHFYNSAASGLTLDGFAKGDETVELINLTPERKTTFRLPDFQLGSLIRFESGEMLPGPVFLDTVHIDTFSERVFLTWRTVYPTHVPIRALEIRAKDMRVESPVPRQPVELSRARCDFDEEDIYYPAFA